MNKMFNLFLVLELVIFLTIVNCESSLEISDSESDNARDLLFNQRNGPCRSHQYRCQNNKCIDKGEFCNDVDNCGDNSDEKYCHTSGLCPTDHQYIRCGLRSYYNQVKCIPKFWKCDGYQDCDSGGDEKECEEVFSYQVNTAKLSARKWIFNERSNQSRLQKWGTDVTRTAVAFFFSKGLNFTREKHYTEELAYELSVSLLSKLALKKIEDIETSDLAAYVNSFLTVCIDPRKFYMIDLIEELRKRVNFHDVANPFAMLALCNAQEFITDKDIEKLQVAFLKANEKHRIDTQALIIMVLACASAQPDSSFSREELSEYTLEIKNKQYRNGTVENIKTTALVLQALFSSEPKPDEDNFDEEKAMKQILRSQEGDGSFGGLMNTYYVLPVLSMLSLVNISGDHCQTLTAVETEGLEHLRIQVGIKWNVTYSIWIGDDKVLQRRLTLSVPANTSFYGIMEYAAGVDQKYKFEYNVRNRKPYLYALSGIMDDPEMETFWYPYYLFKNSSEPTLISKSPADVIPKNSEHLVYWYRKMA